TDRHVIVQAGAWTVALTIDKRAPYPRIEAALPPATSYLATWDFSAENVELLCRRLPAGRARRGHRPPLGPPPRRPPLPGRGWGAEAAAGVGLPWAHLPCHALRVVTSRRCFLRALELGFREFFANAPDGVIQCRDGSRLYAWTGWDVPRDFVARRAAGDAPAE